MKTAAIKVDGLLSEACIDRIEWALKGVTGVEDVVVSLFRSLVTVRFDETRTYPSRLESVIAQAGYLAHRFA
ncbi:heavy-metal-associated domain-containing protein [Noviherbaspirillum pedocola]|uniref:Heavy-metal-associated domain-containing protein n=1 Tax=Noviherbaspirillum pedocola TaxID=2801341 RepID=A0A934STH9_9BURK|nr:heavy-metal-associated domain-containing protein [Noviherbaspirillum pedocola]MBK4734928.1 heavy-metal-associated domain-containing protein [Noviherbaspirillum pedocola]